METYSYTSIDSTGSQIRLLTIPLDVKQILGRANVKPLTGSLNNYYLPLSTLPRAQRLVRNSRLPIYIALSYVWGDPTRSHDILIDGKRLPITSNLYDALRALQKDATSEIRVWADAICINQGDSVEKSAQIRLMREIYHASTEVRIYLGPGSEDVKKCLDFMNNLTDAYIVTDDPSGTEDSALEEGFLKAVLYPGGVLGDGFIRFGQSIGEVFDVISPTARDDKAKMLLDSDEGLSLHEESIKSFAKWRPSKRHLRRVQGTDFIMMAKLLDRTFLEKDWFLRMWVVQEIGSSDYVGIQLGGRSIKWDYLVQTLYYLHFSCNIKLDHIRRVTGLEKIRLGWNDRKRQPLRDLIRECRYRQSTDPRDKIYSLLGLMGDGMNPYLEPDYNKPVNQVYSNVAHHFLTQYASLDVLCGWQTLGRDESLPFWVPDYNLNQDLAAFTLVPTDGRESMYAASGYGQKFQQRDSEPANWSRLGVYGLFLDSIATLSDPGAEDESLDSIEIRWQSLLSAASGLLEGLTSEVQSFLTDISTAVNKYSQIQHLADPSSLSFEPVEVDPHFHDIDIIEAYIHTLLSGRISTKERLTKDTTKAIMSFQLPSQTSDLTPQSWYEKVCAALEAGMTRRKLGISKKGHVGAFPLETMPGDLICILFGCSVPVVLREMVESDCYMFVGECYLHGFMDAEAIVMQLKETLKARDFILG